MDKSSNTSRVSLICLLLVLANITVYYQVYTFDFVNYDDPEYVQQNQNIKNGITSESLKWAFTTGYACFWHPLTWISHMLDYQLFGADSAGHHLTSLIFHIVNTLLLFLVLKQMTKVIWPSAFVAALFALHPLHIESVAWVSERKDVLSTFFWFLTMWAYVRYTHHPRITVYLLMIVFFVLGLMSKPMLVTLPFVFLLLDYWPLSRIRFKNENMRGEYSLPRLVTEKVPLFAIALTACAAAYIAQKAGRAIPSGESYTLPIRLANAAISYIQYIVKMVWPVNLAMFYPHPGKDISFLYAAASALLLLVVTVIVLRFSRNHRYLLTGWLWYIGALVPVIGIVQVGRHAMADRYTYVTMTGLFIIIAWGIPDLLEKLPHKKIILWTFSLIVLSVLAVSAHLQTRCWRDNITLCENALEVTDENYRAHFCISLSLIEQDRLDEAIWHCNEAIRINPDCYEAYNNLGVALCGAGRFDDAIRTYKTVIEREPDLAISHGNLASILESRGAYSEAAEHCRIALETMDTIPIRKILASALLHLARYDEAIIEYRKILTAAPDDAGVLVDLGCALARSGKYEQAISVSDDALQIDPNFANAHMNLGFAFIGTGRFAEAEKEYEKVLSQQPENALAHSELAVALFHQDKLDRAVEHLNTALRVDPNNKPARDNLSFILAEKQKRRNENDRNEQNLKGDVR